MNATIDINNCKTVGEIICAGSIEDLERTIRRFEGKLSIMSLKKYPNPHAIVQYKWTIEECKMALQKRKSVT